MNGCKNDQHPLLIRVIVAVASLFVGLLELMGLVLFAAFRLLRTPAGIVLLAVALIALGILQVR